MVSLKGDGGNRKPSKYLSVFANYGAADPLSPAPPSESASCSCPPGRSASAPESNAVRRPSRRNRVWRSAPLLPFWPEHSPQIDDDPACSRRGSAKVLDDRIRHDQTGENSISLPGTCRAGISTAAKTVPGAVCYASSGHIAENPEFHFDAEVFALRTRGFGNPSGARSWRLLPTSPVGPTTPRSSSF